MDLESYSPSTKILTLAAVSLTLAWIIYRWIRSRNYPPGPVGLPILGYIPFLSSNPHFKLTELSKKYGDVFSVYLGSRLNIIVSDYKEAKELLSLNMLLTRPPNSLEFLPGDGGFLSMSGWPWQEQRRFTFHAMRDLGLGKGPWETMTQEDALEFVEKLKVWKGAPVNFHNLLSLSQANNNIDMLIGRRLDKTKDRDFIMLMHDTVRALSANLSTVGILNSYRKVAMILARLKIGKTREFMDMVKQMGSFFRKAVEQRMKHKESWEQGDLIGDYLQEMDKKQNDSEPHFFSAEKLVGILFMLFISGSDSTLGSLSWLLCLMATHQDIQKKVYKEIDEAIGSDRLIYYEYRTKTPYLMATIMEMHRWASIAPIFPPRYVFEDFTHGDYTIPKGSNIVVNNWAVSHDPRYFEKPMEFRPERFMEGNEVKSIKTEGYLPFSLGRRNCPGEGTSLMTTYLYFANIMQKFHVTTPHGGPAKLQGVFGGAHIPVHQQLCFKER